MKLRIGLVSLHTSPLTSPGAGDAGGMNIVIRHQAEALAARGHQVEIITRRQDDQTPDFDEVDERITLRRLTAGPPRMLAKSQQDEHIAEFSAALAAIVPDTVRPYDVVHSHHWMSGMAALPVARRWGVPHLQSYHSIAAPVGSALAAGEPPESPDRSPGEAFLARESDVVVAISRAEATTVIERLGGSPERIRVVPPGVDTTMFSPGPSLAHAPGYVLAAARLQPLKGIDLAVEALALVPASLRPRLVVAGDVSDDFADYREHLHRLVLEHGLEEDVHFIGPRTRPELADLLRGARICLVASHSETFGLIALEASASGVPVIASAAGGLVEAVDDGRTGLLMPTREPADWAAAIERLLSDDGLAARLGSCGRERAHQQTWELAAARLEQIYLDTLGRTP